jgi:hypothetical protein
VAIKDSADGWVRAKPMQAIVFVVVGGLVVGGVIGLAAGYKIEQNRVASGVNRLKAQINQSHQTKSAAKKPAVKGFGLSNERVGSVTAIGTTTISLRTQRFGVLQLHTTSLTKYEQAGTGSHSDITVGSRALVTIGGDVLVLANGSLLGRPITKVAGNSFSYAKANAAGTATIAFSHIKVLDVLSGASRSDVKTGTDVLIGGRTPSKGDFVVDEVIVLPTGSGFAK